MLMNVYSGGILINLFLIKKTSIYSSGYLRREHWSRESFEIYPNIDSK